MFLVPTMMYASNLIIAGIRLEQVTEQDKVKFSNSLHSLYRVTVRGQFVNID
jgi:hypothetical protein